MVREPAGKYTIQIQCLVPTSVREIPRCIREAERDLLVLTKARDIQDPNAWNDAGHGSPGTKAQIRLVQ
eukprot:373946-Pyramimonas_sp.AAC.1